MLYLSVTHHNPLHFLNYILKETESRMMAQKAVPYLGNFLSSKV